MSQDVTEVSQDVTEVAQRRELKQLEADLRAQGLRLQRGPGKGGRQRRRRAEQAQIQAQRTVASALD